MPFWNNKVSLKNNFKMKHCNISKYLFPFKAVEMQCVTLAYSFALTFLFNLSNFLSVTWAALAPLKFCFLGWIYSFLKEYLFSFALVWSVLTELFWRRKYSVLFLLLKLLMVSINKTSLS